MIGLEPIRHLGRWLGRAVVIVCLAWLINPGRSPRVTLAFMGDVMLGRGVAAAGALPSEVMSAIEPELASADLVMANLESPLTDQPPQDSSGYVLCAPSTQARVLAASGLDLVSLANNHHLDCGEQGLEDTRRTLEGSGIKPIGPGLEVVYRDMGMLRMAFIALDDVSSPVWLATAKPAIARARASNAFVVVSIHWGAEYQGAPNLRQRAIAKDLIRAGAGIVWGHHPHVLQPVERIGCDLPRACLVLYSLGNAVFDQPGLVDTRRSAVLLVRLDQGGVIDVRAVPFMIDVQHGRMASAEPRDSIAVMERLGPEVVPAEPNASR